MGEAALHALFGYQLEGCMEPSDLEPEKIRLMQFDRKQTGAD
jgi:hypothetical protein